MPFPPFNDVIAAADQGRADSMAERLSSLVEVLPTSVTAFVLLAHVKEAQQEWDSALSAWRRAAFLMPNSPAALAGVDRCLRSQSIAVAARQVTQDAVMPFEDETPTAEFESAPQAEEGPLYEPLPYEENDEVSELRDEEVVTEEAGADSRLPTGSVDVDDLDRLISELEGARITPTLDENDLPAPDLEDEIDDMVSETLALIYKAQKQYGEAARVYERLAVQQPERSREFMKQAIDLRSRATG